MKRIVDGKTYNTDTATKVAGARIEGPDQDFTQQTLYVTRGGAFFIHQFERTFFFDQDAEPRRWHQDAESFIPLTRDEVQDWFLKGDVEIFNDIFEEPPEASGDQPPEPEATIYIRVPEPLKRQIDETAKNGGQSTNAWAMRCFEQCLSAEDVVDLALKSGRALMEMPTPLGKPLGDCTNEDVQWLEQRYSRLTKIHGRLADGKKITPAQHRLVKNEAAHEAVVLGWALGKGA